MQCWMQRERDQLPPSWCDSLVSLFPDEKENATAEDSKNHHAHYSNCDYSVFVRDCEQEVIEPLAGTVTGSIPKWLRGILLRNGMGKLTVGKYSFQHLFDGSALLHKFRISDGEVTYQRRFVQTEVYKKNMAAQRIVVTEVGTKAIPDPCQSIFRRIASIFYPNPNFTDNTMVSIYPLGDEYYTFTEASVIHRIDPQTLETLGKVNVSKYVNIVNHTAHPFVMADGTMYNIGLNVTPLKSLYNIVCFYPSRVIIDESLKEEKKLSMFDQATIVASVPSKWRLNPSYMHSFGITKNYFIIVEQPLAISIVTSMINFIKQQPLIDNVKWYENENTLIHVISRETGQVVRTFVAETFCFFHVINQFETLDGDYVVLDLCCYRDSKLIESLYVDSLKNMRTNPDYGKLTRSRPLRFVLPMKQPQFDASPERNLIAIRTVHQSLKLLQNIDESVNPADKLNFEMIDNFDDKVEFKVDEHSDALKKKPAAHLLPDGRIFVKPELLCDLGCELPRINADSHLGREYRYFYAISSDMDADHPGMLIKVDTFRKARKIWYEKDVYPSEPIFVPDPKGKKEDDGVVVSSLFWTGKYENRVGLLILDAASFTEIAKVTFETPGPTPKCVHGWFSME